MGAHLQGPEDGLWGPGDRYFCMHQVGLQARCSRDEDTVQEGMSSTSSQHWDGAYSYEGELWLVPKYQGRCVGHALGRYRIKAGQAWCGSQGGNARRKGEDYGQSYQRIN